MVAAAERQPLRHLSPIPSAPAVPTPGGAVSWGGFTWCCDAVAPGYCFIRWPGAVWWDRVRPYGDRFTLPAGQWVPISQVHPYSTPPAPPAPPQPIGPGLIPGATVRKGTSISPWFILSVDGAVARVRPCSGYAAAMVLEVPLASLSLWE